MKNFKIFAMFAMLIMLASCADDKKKQEPVVTAPPPVEVYQPVHQTASVDLNAIKTYEYRNAPTGVAATSVEVKYDATPYAQPIEIKYSYANGDTFTYEYLTSTTVTITAFSGNDEPHKITVPAKIESYDVTAIGEQAF